MNPRKQKTKTRNPENNKEEAKGWGNIRLVVGRLGWSHNSRDAHMGVAKQEERDVSLGITFFFFFFWVNIQKCPSGQGSTCNP